MIASAASGAALVALGLGLGCAGATPMPTSPLEPLGPRAATAPGDRDRAARDLAAALLASPDAVEAAQASFAGLEAERVSAGAAPSGLLAYARDAANARLGPRERRQASRALLESGVPDGLAARLEKEIADEPLRLARTRLRDARWRRFGRRVNAVVEPLGRSIANLALLPVRLLPALVELAVAEHAAPELSTPERQALDHWKHFLERNPDAPEAAALLARVERAQRRWYRTQRENWLRAARRSWRSGDTTATIALAERALRYAPEDEAASALLAEAEARAGQERSARARALEAAADAHLGGVALARALLAPHGNVDGAAEALLAEPRGPLADEARFALALVSAEAGRESESWRQLEKLAKARDARSAMARHARALVESPQQNPQRAWRLARRAARGDGARWLFFGPLARGARQRDLPRPVEWLVEVPTLLPVVLGFPDRLVRLPFARSARRSPGVFARRYLERHPEGEHAGALRRWLVGYETSRDRPLAALQAAQQDPDFDPKRLAKLREKAAAQLLARARGEQRLDRRVAGLQRVAAEHPESAAAREAGVLLRETVSGASAQRIRVSRGFLHENPEVAGPGGLGLRPELLDGDPGNGELHVEGVTLLGGRDLELAFLAASGRESDAPERRRQRISEERLTRTVSLLEEAAFRNAHLDRDQPFAPDADRDLFFERARFGLAEAGPRVTARSTFVYEGVRERYGVVRGRESVLPVDLVLRGSLGDFGLGAFPRVRMPRETPDAHLYR